MKADEKFKVLLVWILFAFVTLLFIVFLFIRINQTKEFKTYDDIAKTNYLIRDITVQGNSGDYYVFVYSSSNGYESAAKNTDLEPIITNYFTYYHQNKKIENLIPIYLYDIDKFKSSADYPTCSDYFLALYSSMDISKCPALVIVSEGMVSSVITNLGGSGGIKSTIATALRNGSDNSK